MKTNSNIEVKKHFIVGSDIACEVENGESAGIPVLRKEQYACRFKWSIRRCDSLAVTSPPYFRGFAQPIIEVTG